MGQNYRRISTVTAFITYMAISKCKEPLLSGSWNMWVLQIDRKQSPPFRGFLAREDFPFAVVEGSGEGDFPEFHGTQKLTRKYTRCLLVAGVCKMINLQLLSRVLFAQRQSFVTSSLEKSGENKTKQQQKTHTRNPTHTSPLHTSKKYEGTRKQRLTNTKYKMPHQTARGKNQGRTPVLVLFKQANSPKWTSPLKRIT